MAYVANVKECYIFSFILRKIRRDKFGDKFDGLFHI